MTGKADDNHTRLVEQEGQAQLDNDRASGLINRNIALDGLEKRAEVSNQTPPRFARSGGSGTSEISSRSE